MNSNKIENIFECLKDNNTICQKSLQVLLQKNQKLKNKTYHLLSYITDHDGIKSIVITKIVRKLVIDNEALS